jgi:murein DD-endopeptidase MepM/ murein hydrolase activator NlpD
MSLLVFFGSWLVLLADGNGAISHRARSLQPGEILAFKVQIPKPADQSEAEAFGRVYPFYLRDELKRDQWEGLVGIDLNVSPGRYPIHIRAKSQGKQVFEQVYTVKILAKEFPTRRLKVDPKFATPPKEELERIRRESNLVSNIFAGTTPARFWEGSFVRPVSGEVISSFGKRSIVNGRPRSPHSGADFRAGLGTPVKAPNSGKVVLVADLYFAGNTVIVDHGLGLYSYFAHLSESSVSEGEKVCRGAVIGKVGATGRVTGPHLHWTLRLSGARVDPMSLMTLLED